MRRTEARLTDHAQGVVFLEEKLPRSVEANSARGISVPDFRGPLTDQVHGLVPGGGLKHPASANERADGRTNSEQAALARRKLIRDQINQRSRQGRAFPANGEHFHTTRNAYAT